jgi:DNA-directed RNA polymerase specialized sigma24 family protein
MQIPIVMPSHDKTALEILYQQHMPELLSFIRRYISTREDAEDVLLEVFIALFERQSLAGLSDEEQQTLLHLRFAHGLRSPEIAIRLNKSEGAGRQLLSRTLNILRRPYEKPEEGDCKDE